MSDAISKNRRAKLILKRESQTGGDVIGGIISACELAIVVSVHGNAVVKHHGGTCSDQQTVPADRRTSHSETVVDAVCKTRYDGVVGVAEFMLPRCPKLRLHHNMTHMPII